MGSFTTPAEVADFGEAAQYPLESAEAAEAALHSESVLVGAWASQLESGSLLASA